MKRDLSSYLSDWLKSNEKKPLIMRGARQVGKTWLIRDFARENQRELIEFNFEKRPAFESLFESNDPKEIAQNIEALTGNRVDPARTILFLDEIQAAPHLLAKLRWFAEEMPDLPLIAAGSLLDFALDKHEFSMPVGRVSYLYLEPLSFEEFLDAVGEKSLRDYLQNYQISSPIAKAIHEKLMKLLKEYLIVGGMPAAVLSWVAEKELKKVQRIHYDLLSSYRDDFAKYHGRLDIQRLEDVLNSVPRQLAKKFVYKEANPDISSSSLKQALDLLTKARVCHRILSTAANGLPLGAEADEKFSKMIMLDCGLCSTLLGLSIYQLSSVSELSLINSGGISEQLVGQLLRATFPPYIPPSLYYWQRKKSGAEAEVDYIIQHENSVIPLEVKAGTTGTLKSLHQFIKGKKRHFAVRINSDFPSLYPVEVKDATGDLIQYELLSLPFYFLGQLHRLISGVKKP